MFALIDCNNFYCSAERLMRPSLNNKPIIVLSNNDGCCIARSNEAKALGVKMGQPFYQLRGFIEDSGIIALSANFELYSDISDRVMSLAAGLGPLQEIYSIDECFISELSGVRDVTQRAWAIRERILRWVGIPTCIGIAPTKTLSKLCNHVAKDSERKPGSYLPEFSKVCNWYDMDNAKRDDILRRTAAGDIWGIGRKISVQLADQGFLTAWDVTKMSTIHARKYWGLGLERTVRELQGTSCIPMESCPPPKQQIACTRSFGHAITTLPPLIEAVSTFAARAAEKLRAGNQRAGVLHVFAHTSPFRPGPRFFKTASMQLQPATSDTQALVSAAVRGLQSIYEPGFALSKAGVMLLELSTGEPAQFDLIAPEPDAQRDRSALMETMDRLNARFGKNTLHVAGTGTLQSDESGWRMRQERRTPRYTTRIDEIPIVRA